MRVYVKTIRKFFKVKKYFNFKMEVSMTKISKNGQIVIPAEIRRDAGIEPFTKFLVFNEGGNILLKKIQKEKLARDIELINNIEQSEYQIAKGNFTKVNASMKDEDIDEMLTN